MRALLDTKRLWLPVVGAFACLVTASWFPPLVTFVLIMAAFALLFDACTAWFAKVGGASLRDHKQ